MTDTGRIRAYYDGFDEWGRLDAPAGRLEFERTLALLDRRLAPASRVLDLGGGPGRYTIALAQCGHRVWLADISPQQLAVAREKIAEAGVGESVESIDEATATDLAIYADGAFDAVVALGPFYHLVTEDERTQAAREIARVLDNGGLLFAAFMPRLTGLAGLIDRATADAAQVPPDALAAALETGVFQNPTARGFQEGFYAEPDEIGGLFAAQGFTRLDLQSLRGLAFGREDTLLALRDKAPALYESVVSLVDATAQDPRVIALCGHALYVGKKDPP